MTLTIPNEVWMVPLYVLFLYTYWRFVARPILAWVERKFPPKDGRYFYNDPGEL